MRRLLLCLALIGSACSSLPPAEPRPVPLPLARTISETRAAAARGQTDEVAKARERYPDSVDLARIEQNLRLGRGEAWQTYEAALARARAFPGDPAALYLVGRLVPDREEQQRWFERALRLDPSFYFANYGLAVVRLERGAPEDAARYARRALAIRGGAPEARLVLARALAAEGGGDAAEVVLGGLLLEDPADTDAAVALADLLDHAGRKEEAFGVLLRPGDDPAGRRERFVRAWDLLDGVSLPGAVLARGEKACREVLGASPREAAADLLLGRILLDSGDPGGALAALDRAVANGARAAAVREDRLRAALGSGAFGRARRILEAGLPSELLREPGNTRRAAFERLLAALGAAGSGPERADRLAELARALSGMGFDREAADYAGRAVARAPERAGLEDLLSDLCAWRDFLGAVRTELHRRYLEFSASGGSATLSEMKAVLARISREHLGRDVVTGLPEESWPFVGAVARSDLTGAPPDWEDHGTVFVLGRRVSGPLEATMMRLVARFPARREAEGTYSLVVGEGQTLRSYFEEGAGRIAGFTLPGWVLMNLDVVNRWEAEVRSLAKGAGATPLWPAPDRVRRESLWFPAGVRERLAVEYIAAAGAKNGTFQSALCHEKGHLLEADRYLPVLTSLPSVLGLLIGHGFSVSGIEVQLERDAEIHALAVSPYPRNALIDTMAFLPHENSAPPHSRAYYGILRCLVREIARHPGRYPSIDPAFNVLEQLDRLSKEELAAAVQRSLSPD